MGASRSRTSSTSDPQPRADEVFAFLGVVSGVSNWKVIKAIVRVLRVHADELVDARVTDPHTGSGGPAVQIHGGRPVARIIAQTAWATTVGGDDAEERFIYSTAFGSSETWISECRRIIKPVEQFCASGPFLELAVAPPTGLV